MIRFILFIALFVAAFCADAQTNGKKSMMCPGDTVYISARSEYTDYYKWYKNTAFLCRTDTNIVMVTETGAYTAVAYNNNGCKSDESEKVIIIKKVAHALDDSAFVHKNSTVKIPVINNDLAACSPFDTNSIKIFQQPWQGYVSKRRHGVLEYIPYDHAGGIDQFTYKIYDEDGDESNLACVTIYIGVACGIVYPNPVTDLVNIRVDDETVKYIRLCDVTGKILQARHASLGVKQINMGGYADGLYIIQLVNGSGKSVCTFKVLSENGH